MDSQHLEVRVLVAFDISQSSSEVEPLDIYVTHIVINNASLKFLKVNEQLDTQDKLRAQFDNNRHAGRIPSFQEVQEIVFPSGLPLTG